MNEKLYAGNMHFGALEIDTNKIFAMVGQVVSVRLVNDPFTGQPRWLAITEMASRVNAKGAWGVHALKLLVHRISGSIRRQPVFYKSAALIMGLLLIVGMSFHNDEPVGRMYKIAKKPESDIDMEIRRFMEKGINLEYRRLQVPAIVAAFARRTDQQRAVRLAALCYLKTLGTPFMPIDIAVIALAETGEFGLSAKAVSPKGAMGVWQLMPKRAMSHGYSPTEMKNDEKCAEAAVRELTSKLQMAKGNLARAKKLYCGMGPQADAYAKKIKEFKMEILNDLSRIELQRNTAKEGGTKDLS
jgi:hypothetical protein